MKYTVFCLFPVFTFVHCFVFDETNIVILTPQGVPPVHKSHFGYSLDIAKENGKSWVLVGAPKDGAKPTGSLSSCSLDFRNGENMCQAQAPNLSGAPKDDKFEDQLLGVSVLAVAPTGANTEVWACAPRFQRPREKSWNNNTLTLTYSLMLGNCFVYSGRDDFTKNRREIPLEKHTPIFFGRGKMYNEYAYGTVYSELGMAINYDAAENRILFGAPGSWNWTGTIVVNENTGPNVAGVMTQPWSDFHPILNDYTGYSIASGNVLSKSTRPRQYIAGAPRAGPYRTGSIFVIQYDQTPNIKQVFTVNGRQTGEYFGAAVAVADLDGDGIQEILVGAPLFTNNKDKRLKDEGYDEGRISIFALGSNSQNFVEKVSIFGQKNGARFGQAIMALGDLDGDGYEDFAVGSPYEDKGRGCVRIYLGRQNILKIQDPHQIINASILNPQLKGFGVSFSAAIVDLDSNNLPDIAIGSHMSGHAVVLRRRPTVSVIMVIKPDIQNVNPEEKEEFTISACLTLRSEQAQNAFLRCQLQLTSDSRAVFTEHGSGPLTSSTIDIPLNLQQNVENCFEATKVKMKAGFNQTSMEPPLTFSAQLVQKAAEGSLFDGMDGVLDPRKRYWFNLTIPFQTECGSDNMCAIDLGVTVDKDSIPSPFLIGSDSWINQKINIENNGGEPAYLPVLKIPVPSDLIISQQPKECRMLPDNVLRCDVPGPIKSGGRELVEIKYEVSKLRGGHPPLEWNNIEVFSDSDETSEANLANNKVNFKLELKTEADLEISSSDEIVTRIYQQSGKPKDVSFSQVFQIRNVLKTPVDGNTAKVQIPTSFNGIEFIQVSSVTMTFPEGQDKVKCTQDKEIRTEGTQDYETDGEIDISCLRSKVVCSTYRCPEFSLGGDDKPVVLDVQLKFITGLIISEIKDNDVIYSTEGHVTLQPDLQVDLDQLNTRPDNVFYKTRFTTQKTSLASVNMWFIVGAVIAALFLLLLVLVIMIKCGCFKRKKSPENDPDFTVDGDPHELQELNQQQQPQA